MSFRNRMTPAELKLDGFTHKGWYAFIVPVYVNNSQPKFPIIVERNWIPEWYLDGMQSLVDWLGDRLIRVTGEIK